MQTKEDKSKKLVSDILKDLANLKSKIHSDFIKIDIALLEEKLKKLFDIK